MAIIHKICINFSKNSS